MDRLQECAEEFNKLLDLQYHIIIGRKGQTVDLTIEFAAIDFHHLMGLGKLKDIRIAELPREQVFAKILNGDISESDINKSRYISDIQNRFIPLAAIEEILDSNQLVFRYNSNQNKGSSIEADYLLSTPYNGTDVYIFLSRKDEPDKYFCRSFFPKEKKDYTVGQSVYTLLFKEKITVSTGERIVQYDKLTPKQNIESETASNTTEGKQ